MPSILGKWSFLRETSKKVRCILSIFKLKLGFSLGVYAWHYCIYHSRFAVPNRIAHPKTQHFFLSTIQIFNFFVSLSREILEVKHIAQKILNSLHCNLLLMNDWFGKYEVKEGGEMVIHSIFRYNNLRESLVGNAFCRYFAECRGKINKIPSFGY